MARRQVAEIRDRVDARLGEGDSGKAATELLGVARLERMLDAEDRLEQLRLLTVEPPAPRPRARRKKAAT